MLNFNQFHTIFHHFALETVDMKVVDLGTEFAMSVSEDGADVQVFDGDWVHFVDSVFIDDLHLEVGQRNDESFVHLPDTLLHQLVGLLLAHIRLVLSVH